MNNVLWFLTTTKICPGKEQQSIWSVPVCSAQYTPFFQRTMKIKNNKNWLLFQNVKRRGFLYSHSLGLASPSIREWTIFILGSWFLISILDIHFSFNSYFHIIGINEDVWPQEIYFFFIISFHFILEKQLWLSKLLLFWNNVFFCWIFDWICF